MWFRLRFGLGRDQAICYARRMLNTPLDTAPEHPVPPSAVCATRRNPIEFAVHYSRAAADLLAQGRIIFDRFKCPAWPDLVEAVRRIHPTYVHFALIAGCGTGNVIDGETKRDADWATVETLRRQTGTPFIGNVHFSPTVRDYPDIPRDTEAPEHVERLTEALIRDVRAVAVRFGLERAITVTRRPACAAAGRERC